MRRGCGMDRASSSSTTMTGEVISGGESGGIGDEAPESRRRRFRGLSSIRMVSGKGWAGCCGGVSSRMTSAASRDGARRGSGVTCGDAAGELSSRTTPSNGDKGDNEGAAGKCGCSCGCGCAAGPSSGHGCQGISVRSGGLLCVCLVEREEGCVGGRGEGKREGGGWATGAVGMGEA